MARVVVVAVALALVAVLAPGSFGHAHVVRAAPVSHAVAAGTEEEPTRECRGGPESRSWSTRSSPARPPARPRRATPAAPRRDATAPVTPPGPAGHGEHLRSWSSPAALQVFRH